MAFKESYSAQGRWGIDTFGKKTGPRKGNLSRTCFFLVFFLGIFLTFCRKLFFFVPYETLATSLIQKGEIK